MRLPTGRAWPERITSFHPDALSIHRRADRAAVFGPTGSFHGRGCAMPPVQEGANVQEYDDKVLLCMDCSGEFIFTAGEQLFFADKGLRNEPKRCKDCKHRRNERIAANVQTLGPGIPRARVEVSVRCALCAVETTVPFRPTQGRPVYCRDCFLKMRASVAHPPVPML